jgi:hypothetical protein
MWPRLRGFALLVSKFRDRVCGRTLPIPAIGVRGVAGHQLARARVRGRLDFRMPAESLMSSHSDHARPNLCRNRITRSPWALPLLLLIASPLTRGLAIGGTLVFGTGCAEPTLDDCDQWLTECLEVCAADDGVCQIACYDEQDVCIEEAQLAKERNAERVEAVADATAACLAIAVCTLDALEEGEGEGDEDDGPEPEPEGDADDWGEDWGEQSPSEDLELASQAQWTDLPEE